MRRREFLRGVAAGAVGLSAATAVASPARADGREAPAARPAETGTVDLHPLHPAVRVEGPAPWALLAPWAVGAEVAEGWALADVSHVAAGGFVFTLARGERGRARVAVCGRAAAHAVGLAQSGRCDLVLLNMGDGDAPTDESVARVLRLMAEQLRRNEQRDEACVPRALLSYEARVARYGARVLL